MSFREIKSFPVLYGLASTGKVKQWKIDVVEIDGIVNIRTNHGYMDGKIQTGLKEILYGKNIGKSNETSPEEQAILEATSAFNKKVDKGYIETMSEPSKKELPMLAHPYEDRKHEVNWGEGVFGQPKLNGIRCKAVKISETEMYYESRGGKPFSTLDVFTESLLLKLNVGEKFDGEIFTPKLTFQEICAAVKREKTENPNTKLLEYWVYDMSSHSGDFHERIEEIYARVDKDNPDDPIKRVSTVSLNDENHMKEYHIKNVRNGYEGTMIRNSLGKYRYNHRSVNLLKYKDFMDEEFIIVGGNEGQGKAKGQCTFRCVTSEGKEFDVRCKGSNSVREEQWQNLDSYIGKALTVKFQAWSDDMVPIFPVGISIRDYE